MKRPSKTLAGTPVVAVILALVVIGIAVLVYLQIRRRKRSDKLYDAVKAAIRNDVGAEDNAESDVAKLLLTATCDKNYDATVDAQTLIDAQGGVSWSGIKPDDDTAIFGVLRNKSKAQLKCLDTALNQQHGVSLSEYVATVYGEMWDSDNREKARRIISSAT